MRIENEILLDFDDVLIRPKRSQLSSRKDVSLEREYIFKHSKTKYKGVPIIAANMDTVGTFQMNKALHKFNMMTALHKHYSVENLVKHFSTQDDNEYWNTWYSMGITRNDRIKWLDVRSKWKEINPGGSVYPKVCFDVANGYQESFVDAVKEFREMYPESVIMAGNVVTADMTEALVLAGADIVKVRNWSRIGMHDENKNRNWIPSIISNHRMR